MRNYEDVVIVFFLRRVLDLDSEPSFSEIALDLAHLVFSSPLDYSHFREGNGDRKGKRKKKRREKKEKIRFVASRKLHLSLELFIGNIIYRMKRFSRPVPVFLSPSRESTEFRYRMIKYCRETFARSVRIVSGNFSTTITLRNF